MSGNKTPGVKNSIHDIGEETSRRISGGINFGSGRKPHYQQQQLQQQQGDEHAEASQPAFRLVNNTLHFRSAARAAAAAAAKQLVA